MIAWVDLSNWSPQQRLIPFSQSYKFVAPSDGNRSCDNISIPNLIMLWVKKSTNFFGEKNIIMTSFKHGFKDLAQRGDFCWEFKNCKKYDQSFFTTLSKYNIWTQNKYYSCLEKTEITTVTDPNTGWIFYLDPLHLNFVHM